MNNKIYLIFHRTKSHGDTLETPHSTLTGAKNHFNDIRSYWASKGCAIKEGTADDFTVAVPGSESITYFINCRTVEV